MAKFFVDAMGMKMIQKTQDNAIDLERWSGQYYRPAVARGHTGRRADQAAGHRPYWLLVDNDQNSFV